MLAIDPYSPPDFRPRVNTPGGMGKRLGKLQAILAIQVQNRQPLPVEELPDEAWRNLHVRFQVPADGRVKAQQAADVGVPRLFPEGNRHGLRQRIVEVRQGRIDHFGHEIEQLLQFRRNRGFLVGMFLAMPDRGDLLLHRAQQRIDLAGTGGGFLQFLQIRCNFPLLAQHRGGCGLGRVAREYGMQPNRIDNLDGGGQIRPLLAKLLKYRFRTAPLRLAGVVQVGPAAANPVQLLGGVDSLEPGGEGAGDFLGAAVIQAREQTLQALVRPRVAVATRNRQAARSLDGLEEFPAAPILDHGADQAAELMHVLS